jgi:hypothetical protein
MPVLWEIRGEVLILTLVGQFANEEIEQAVDAAATDGRFRPGMRLLWDPRRSQTAISSADLQWRIGLVTRFARRGLLARFALVLRPDQSVSFEIFASEAAKQLDLVPLRAFTDVTEALSWLEGDQP